MRVKKLELQGFKSFRDKTLINFDAGITGIVGPNGCGKSNIVDAFFWVMGEQNPRHLRGQLMEDLIFSGTDSSSPASYSEVTLTLEMPAELSGPTAPAGASVQDLSKEPMFREVAVTRRLYRNGESDFFINKVPCRLRDIQEIFMDTGVGARGYSIIQQGQISKIVQAKPEERRVMIEEVAGIVKYKNRRKESQSKLEKTQQNLLRVTDITNEIERQKRQMERQAEKAKRYREFKEKLQSLDLQLNSLQWEEIAGKVGALENQLDESNALELALRTKREAEETNITNKRLELTQAQKIAEEFQNNWLKLGQDLSSKEYNLTYQTKSLEDLQATAAQLSIDAEAEKLQAESLRNQYSACEKESQEIDIIFSSAQEKRISLEKAAQAEKNSLDALTQLEETSKQQLLQFTKQNVERTNQAENAKRRLAEINLQSERMNRELQDKQNSLNFLQTTYEKTKTALASSQGNLQNLQNSLEEAVQQITQIQKTIEEDRRKISTLHGQEARQQSTLQSLEQQKQRHEGQSVAVQTIFQKFLPENQTLTNAIIGTLSDLLSVEKGMESAADAALGPYTDIILSQNAEAIVSVANLLKTEHSGRAHFADLSAQLSNAHRKNVFFDQHPDVIGPLAQFIKLETEKSELKDLLNKIIENKILVKSLASAQDLAKKYPECAFVTTQGELCSQGGWYMEAGDAAQVSGATITRNREIVELKTSLELLQKELADKITSLRANEAGLDHYLNTKVGLEAQIREENKILSLVATDDATEKARLLEIENSITQLQSDLSRFQEEQQKLITEAEVASTLAAQLTNKIQEQEAEIIKIQSEITSVKKTYEAAQSVCIEARIEEAKTLEQKNTLDGRLTHARESLNRSANRVEALLQQTLEKKTAAEEKVQTIATLNTEIATLRNHLVAAEQEQKMARDHLHEIQFSLEQVQNSIQTTSEEERKAKDQIGEIRLQTERLIMERDNLRQNTLERYGLELGEYALSPEILEQINALRDRGQEALNEMANEAQLLREKIHRLGEVNTGAIEEYDQLSERLNFLLTQKQDLEKSIADLQTTIDRINKVSKERFLRAFTEVNTQFEKVFPVIFGGGQARLTLTNAEDFLETGVDIMAQPPGKKLQNINLLSGGEKTLTAISLLFAIFLVKPSPFCLLDEVDAPLDDANIGRFNALLKEMAKKSQFIIITHNKRTMELNDKLYGVTMEDAGISKMVSIQMTAA